MARPRVKEPVPPNGFVASAARLPAPNPHDAGKPQGWQKEAWDFFDKVGELRYLATWIGNVLSRAEWHAAERIGNSLEVVSTGPAYEAVEALYGGPQGQANMTAALGTNLCVAGEGYVVYDHSDDSWHTLASGMVTQADDKRLKVNLGDSAAKVMSSRSDLVVRVWTPHPRTPRLADAPTRSNLRTLAQMVGYDDHIAAQLTSRLAGAGVLMLPSEIEFAHDPAADPAATQADAFMRLLAEAMMAPIQDRNSAAAFVPIVVTAPGDLLNKAVHLKFWSDLDSNVVNMREAAVRRFGIGMDVPPEVLQGNAESNHWNAWLSEESAIKAHLEPRLTVIAHALTSMYLRPSLRGVIPDDEVGNWFIVADTSPIRTKPNRGPEAIELWDRALISAGRVLTETGFHPEDRMDGDEYRRWLLQKVAVGAVTPDLATEALRHLGAVVQPVATPSTPAVGQPAPPPDIIPNDRVPPDRVTRDHERNVENQRVARRGEPVGSHSALVASCEMLVLRALERAGNKLKNHHRLTGVTTTADRLYLDYKGDPDKLLDGAWDCAARALDDYEVSADDVVSLLDFYARGLLTRQADYSRATLERLLMADPAVSA
jgi:hypothetical protein